MQKWLLKRNQSKIVYPFLHIFWLKDLYDINTDEADLQALQIIRTKYGNEWNALNPGYLTSEMCNGPRGFHNFGMAPGPYFASHILGVRSEEDASKKTLIIEPRLGDLNFARGTVSTENGPVDVSWKKDQSASGLKFSFNLPQSITAKIGLPYHGTIKNLVINHETLIENGVVRSDQIEVGTRFIYLKDLSGGKLYEGLLQDSSGDHS